MTAAAEHRCCGCCHHGWRIRRDTHVLACPTCRPPTTTRKRRP